MTRVHVRHARFLAAFGLGILAAFAARILTVEPAVSALIGVNALFASYLVLMFLLARHAAPDDLRRHADRSDEGATLIVVLAAASVLTSIGAIYIVLNGPEGGWQATTLALAAIPLGWAMMQTMAAFHYAHLFYRSSGKVGARADQGGLAFPGKALPEAGDFLYFAFVIGMTAQVSDVVITDPGMRRVVLVHAIAAFFYNTVILALAVNAAVALGS